MKNSSIFNILILFYFFFPNFYHLQTLDSPTSPEFDWKAFLNNSPEHVQTTPERSSAQTKTIAKKIEKLDKIDETKREKKKPQRRKYYKNEKARYNALSQKEKDAKKLQRTERQRAYSLRNKAKFGHTTRRVARMKEIRLLEKNNKASLEQLEILRKEREYQKEYYLKRKSGRINKTVNSQVGL